MVSAPPSDPILLLGDPRLRIVCAPVADLRDPVFRNRAARLQAALARFRAEHGFGRAIAAPQIGIPSRFVTMDLGSGPLLLVNPEITWTSEETFTMWDDCMCFPWVLVRVRRHRSISVRFTDGEGRAQEWPRLDPATSELLQHELDHLDGILAIDRALDREAIISRAVFEADPGRFRSQVDYVIDAKSTE